MTKQYKYVPVEPECPDDIVDGQYAILDPEGDELAVVDSEGEAEALVSHLNR